MKAKCLFISWLWIFFAASAGALTVYSLDVGVFKTEGEALARQQELSQRLAPVFVEQTPLGWEVRVGHFLSQAEAWVYQFQLSSDFSGCLITGWPWDGRPLEGSEYLPIERPFDPVRLSELPRTAECLLDYETRGEPPAEAQEALQAVSLEGLTPRQLYDRGDWAADHDLAIDSLQQLLRDAPGSPLANPARLLLARRHLRKRELDKAQAYLDAAAMAGNSEEKSKAALLSAYVILYSASHSAEETYEAFRGVANDPEVSPEDRLDAMLRAASKAHQLQRLSSAWLAYSQLEQAVDTPKVVAFARMNKAAMSFEMVTRNKSNWEETRAFCRAVVDMEGAPVEVKSTAELVYLETFYEQRQYDLCLQAAEEFLQTYSGIKRECAMAQVWMAISQVYLGQKAEALETIEAIWQLDFEYPEHSFHNKNVKAIAAEWALWLNEANPPERERWLTLLLTRYPESPEAQRAQLTYGEIPSEEEGE